MDWRGTPRHHDWITEDADLAGWGHRVGLLDDKGLERALADIAADPAAASKLREEAVAVREAIFALFDAVAFGRSAQEADRELLSRFLARAMGSIRLEVEAPGSPFRLGFDSAVPALRRVLYAAVKSAADLLTNEQIHRVKRCGEPDCGWLFLDTSRNGSRRWCSMESCGNRAKARRHYRKSKSDSSPRG